MKKHRKIIIICILGFVVFSSYFSFHSYRWEYRKKELNINFFSLNRGRAIFIITPENKVILIGGGQNTEVIREITNVLPFYKRKIDKVVIPSATASQIGGLLEVVNRYEVEEILIPKIISTSTVLTELMKEIRKKKIHVIEVERGDEIEVEKDLKMGVLFPYSDFKYNKTSLPELAIGVKYKNTGAYLLGNLSKTIQKDIAKNFRVNTKENIAEFYNSAVESKVSSELIDLIKPKYTFSTDEKTMYWTSNGEMWNRN